YFSRSGATDMAIVLRCPNASCNKQLRVSESFAGKRAKCPACGQTLTIPASGPVTAASAPATSQAAGKLPPAAASADLLPPAAGVLPAKAASGPTAAKVAATAASSTAAAGPKGSSPAIGAPAATTAKPAEKKDELWDFLSEAQGEINLAKEE